MRALRASIVMVAAVRDASGMHLATAKRIVTDFCEGRLRPLRSADLELLAISSGRGGDFFTLRERDDAILDRTPWLLYARKSKQAVYVIASAIPLAALPSPLREGLYGSRSGASVSFESVAPATRAAAAGWPSEIAIERNDPDERLLRLLRVPVP